MLGFNGGLLGKRRTPTLAEAKGLWFQNEQSVARREAIWPVTLGSILDYSPILWYDFADESKVTISSSQITSVTDQGSLGLNLTKSSTGPAYTTAINGRKCVDWGARGHANYLRNTTSIASIGEIYIVLNAQTTYFSDFSGLVSSATDSGDVFYVNGYGAQFTYYTLTEVFVNGSASSTTSTASLGSPALVRLKKSDNSSFASSTGFQIGQDRNYDYLNRGWPGFIGEVVAFASPLGTIQRTNVETILAIKWGLTLS